MANDDPWDGVMQDVQAATLDAVIKAVDQERKRCLAIVTAEIARGEVRGVPPNAAVMLLLRRVEGAIRDGIQVG